MLYQRGIDLMNKITLDTMSYSLFEQKPIPYETYMQMYGHTNTVQSSSQTHDNCADEDTQTDSRTTGSMWTQYPPHFSSKHIFTKQYREDRVGCGAGDDDAAHADNTNSANDLFGLDASLQTINKLGGTNAHDPRNYEKNTKPIDYERLHRFLLKSSITMSSILAANASKRNLKPSVLPDSQGYIQLNYRDCSVLLRETKVYKVYASSKLLNVMCTAHCCDSGRDTHYIAVWSLLDIGKPLHILSSWSAICCMEIHPNFPDAVVAGLSDG